MSSQHFRIDEHNIEASHIRSFPRALATHENDVLHLAIKQYTPLSNPKPQDGDVTIIAAHANAFPKVGQFDDPSRRYSKICRIFFITQTPVLRSLALLELLF